MIKNYFKIAWRNLIKNKTFTILNVFGLSIAFGAAILLSMAAFFDLSYDSFHKNGKDIYLTYSIEQTPKGSEASTTQPAPFASTLQAEVPGVAKITRFLEDNALTIYKDKEINLDGIWVDSDFFDMFTFHALKGNQSNPLKENSSVVITESTASKLFGSAKAIGKTINILIGGKETPFTISSVVEDHKSQNTLDFEIAIPFQAHEGYTDNKDDWDSQYHDVYVQLKQGISPEKFEKNSYSFIDLHYKGTIEKLKRDGAIADADGQLKKLKLLPLEDVHFVSFRKGYADVSRSVPYLILGVAFLILFIACVNFINMSIAKSSQRLREIGMRKTLGAQKKQLFFQFWTESLFIFIASVMVGILISVLLIDDFKTIFRTGVSFEMLTSPWTIIIALAVILLISLLVGGYPALLLSRLGTIQSLKGKLESSGSNRIRNVLMVVQFGIAILLISGTLILWSQVEFMRNKDLGFDKEQVISFPIDGKRNSYNAVELLRNELADNPNILGVTASDNNLGRGKDGSQYTSIWGIDYKGRGIKTHGLVVDYNYIETLGIELVKGRDFNRNYAADTKSVIINESMAKEMGDKDILSAFLPIDDSIQYPVIGVIKDYNFQDLSKPIQPLTYFLDRDSELYYTYVKVAPDNMIKSFNDVAAVWKKIEPNSEFLGSFLDENIDRTFQREKIMATMITSGSVIAITLSCMGLLAMSLLVVAQRTKEIGVRKVLGASVTAITILLTKDFLRLVVIAFFIASPIAWWLSRKWLDNYANRIDVKIWFFLIAGLLAIAIAMLTVGSRTIKAALKNPIKSLRTE